MSSPKMTRMFGFLPVCACAGLISVTERSAAAAATVVPPRSTLRRLNAVRPPSSFDVSAGCTAVPSTSFFMTSLPCDVTKRPWPGVPASLLADGAFLQFRQHLVEREAPGLLSRREVDVGLQMLGDKGLRRHEGEGSF